MIGAGAGDESEGRPHVVGGATLPPVVPVESAGVRTTYLIVLGAIVITAIAAVVALAIGSGQVGSAGAVIAAIGSAAVGALAALRPRVR
jgi:hypothetical protein